MFWISACIALSIDIEFTPHAYHVGLYLFTKDTIDEIEN